MCIQLCVIMEVSVKMDELEEFLLSNQYPEHVGNQIGKKSFRRKCRELATQDNCLKFVHKPNRSDITGE